MLKKTLISALVLKLLFSQSEAFIHVSASLIPASEFLKEIMLLLYRKKKRIEH